MTKIKPEIKHPGLLIIRDGWGVSDKLKGNAVKLADPQCYKRLLNQYFWTHLEPGGEAVGLPEGQMGNSEVGHMNIGSGRTVYQDLPRINRDLETAIQQRFNIGGYLADGIFPNATKEMEKYLLDFKSEFESLASEYFKKIQD